MHLKSSSSSSLSSFCAISMIISASPAVSCWRSRDELISDVLLWTPHMAAQKQDDQHERTFSSYERIRDVVLKTYLGRWTIGRSGERGSGISVLPARYDDDDDDDDYPWPSLATSPYRSLPLAGLQGYILYPHIAAVCMFELVILLLPSHMWGSIGVHHLWARPCFSSSVLHVWFV